MENPHHLTSQQCC